MDLKAAQDMIATLGFPIAAAAALGYVLYRVLSQLLAGHLKFLDQTTAHLQAQTDLLGQMRDALSSVCKAECKNLAPAKEPRP